MKRTTFTKLSAAVLAFVFLLSGSVMPVGATDPATCTHQNHHIETIEQADCLLQVDGVVRDICDDCGTILDVVVTRWQRSHDYSATMITTQPTCTEPGEATDYCTICGAAAPYVRSIGTIHERIKSGEDEAHALWVVDRTPTCDAAGVRHVSCTICSAMVHSETIPPLGHRNAAWSNVQERYAQQPTVQIDPMEYYGRPNVVTNAATCTESGSVTFICDVCGGTAGVMEMAPRGHDFSEWTQTIAPTTDSEGEQVSTCTRCGETQTQAIPKIVIRPELRVDAGKARPGESVQVSIKVSENTGFVAALVQLQYDPQILTLTAVENGDVFADNVFQPGGNLSAVPFTLVWMDALASQNVTADGTLATLTFTVSENAPVGTTPVTITCSGNSTFDVDLTPVSFDTENGSVLVFTRLAGDVNRDTQVDLKDVTVLLRYLVGGWDVTIDASASDVDGDGATTLKDAVLLRRYLAEGWYVELVQPVE